MRTGTPVALDEVVMTLVDELVIIPEDEWRAQEIWGE